MMLLVNETLKFQNKTLPIFHFFYFFVLKIFLAKNITAIDFVTTIRLIKSAINNFVKLTTWPWLIYALAFGRSHKATFLIVWLIYNSRFQMHLSKS